jgi:hypothetical protein
VAQRPPHTISTFSIWREWFIYSLIRIFGRRYAPGEVTWLRGPIGGAIGDRPYEEIARAEQLSIERLVTKGGLVPVITLHYRILCKTKFV